MSVVHSLAAVLFPHLLGQETTPVGSRTGASDNAPSGRARKRPRRGFPQPHILDDGVPRNAGGWPTITPREMTAIQLIREAERWSWTRDSDGGEGPGPTQIEQFELYTNELLHRNFIDHRHLMIWRDTGHTPLFVKVGGKWCAEFH